MKTNREIFINKFSTTIGVIVFAFHTPLFASSFQSNLIQLSENQITIASMIENSKPKVIKLKPFKRDGQKIYKDANLVSLVGKELPVTQLLNQKSDGTVAYPRKDPSSFFGKAANDTLFKRQLNIPKIVPNFVQDKVLVAEVKQAKQKKEVQIENNEDSIVLTITKNSDNELTVDPDKLNINANTKINLALIGFNKETHYNLYSRNSELLDVSKEHLTAHALNTGYTELFFTSEGKIYIIPINIKDQKAPERLVVDQSITEIKNEVSPISEPASAHASIAAGTEASDKIEKSKADTLLSIENRQNNSQYVLENYSTDYSDQVIQIVDERTVPKLNDIYPAGDLVVNVIGTDFKTQTDSTGHATINNLPNNSRFLVAVIDPKENYMPTISEINTLEGETKITRLNTMRRFTFENYANVAGEVQQENNSSLCGTVYDQNGYVLNNIEVSIDQQSSNPFYFNRFGYLDTSLSTTGENGRFCIFNIAPGPFALTFDDGESSMLVPLDSIASFHHEEDFFIENTTILKTQLAAISTVYNQLNVDSAKANRYNHVDYIELIPFGENDPLESVFEGSVESSKSIMKHHNRIYAISSAPEFENAIYTYDTADSDQNNITPLIPRGFIEDMALYADTVFDPDLGHIIFEFGSASDNPSSVTLKLFDSRGFEVESGWYYGESPQTKSVFFNLNPGTYVAQALDQNGNWLESSTILVYNGTVSYLRLGAKVVSQ